MTNLVVAHPSRRLGHLPTYGALPDDGRVLTGEVVLPELARTAEDVARAWLLGYADNPHTTRGYRVAIEQWFGFCTAAGLDPLHVRRDLVDAYKTWLYDQGRKASTVNARLSAVASFYRYAEDEEAVRRSPMRGVRRAKLPEESASTGLSRDELTAFLAEAHRRGPQMHALMHVLGLNGLRASEPLLCDVDDLGTERGHRILSVRRKGKAASVRIPLAPPTSAALDEWLEARAVLLHQAGKGSGPLFFAQRRGNGEVRRLLQRDVHRYVRALGRVAVPGKPTLHPHDLRHAFVTLSLDAGVPLRDVQDSAGHASPTTTRRYDRNRRKIDRNATYTLAAYLGG
jgi:integrase/recombinase XerD